MKFKRYILILIIIVMCVSCKSTQTLQTHDTVYVNNTEYITDRVIDSVYINRVHEVFVKGDSVFTVDTIYRDRTRLVYDTFIKSDTVFISSHEEVKPAPEKNKCNPIFPIMIIVGCIGFCVLSYKFKLFKSR